MPLSIPQVRTLVLSQLRLDLRHPRTGERRSSRALLTPLSYAFSSLILVLALADRGASAAEVLFAGSSFAAILAAFAIAGSYDELMGRPRDHAHVLTLPASEQTLYAARLLNVLIFGLVVALSAALPLGGLALLHHGTAGAVVVSAAVIGTMLVVMLSVLAAIWLITLAAPLKVQRPALAGARALLVAALVIGYQLVATQPAIVVEARWWIGFWVMEAGLAPSAASVAPFGALGLALLLLFGLAFPSRYLLLLERTAASEALRGSGRRRLAAPTRLESLGRLPAEVRAGFGLAAAAIRSDRLVRGRLWPAVLLAGLFGLFGWWSGGLGSLLEHGVAGIFTEASLKMHLSVLTVLLFASQSAIQALQVSDRSEAGWTFAVLPARNGRALQLGAQRALLWRVLLPLHAVLALLLSVSMPPAHALLHAAFWFAGCALMTRLYALSRREPPLTKRSDQFSAGERFVPLLLAVPAAISLLILQGLTFSLPASALLLVVGLLVVHSALGQLVDAPRQAPSHPALEPAPAPVRRHPG